MVAAAAAINASHLNRTTLTTAFRLQDPSLKMLEAGTGRMA